MGGAHAAETPAALDLAVQQASIDVASSRREVDRLEPLAAQGVAAQHRLDEAKSALASSEAELRSARRQRANLGRSQKVGAASDRLEVPSPIDGVVAELHVAPGAWVQAGQPLARLVDRDRLWLDVGVPEAYVGRLGEVSGVWFTLDGVRGPLELPRSALVSIGTEIDPGSRTLRVRFVIDNIRRELFAGMTSKAHLVTDAPMLAAAIPIDAVIDDNGMDVVFVQTGGESFVRRPVKLGIHDAGFVEVREGVAPGEWVVTRGAWSVKLASASTESVGHGHAH